MHMLTESTEIIDTVLTIGHECHDSILVNACRNLTHIRLNTPVLTSNNQANFHCRYVLNYSWFIVITNF